MYFPFEHGHFPASHISELRGVMANFQERYNTPLEHTPDNPPLDTYERIPLKQPIGKGCSGCVPVRCVETSLENCLQHLPYIIFKKPFDLERSCGWSLVGTLHGHLAMVTGGWMDAMMVAVYILCFFNV